MKKFTPSIYALALWFAFLTVNAQVAPKVEKTFQKADKSGSTPFTSSTSVITPVWSYLLQPVVTRMEYGASPAMMNLGSGVNTIGGEPDSYMEIVTGSDEYSNFYPELNSQAFGLWRCFDALGNLEWAKDTKSDEAKSSVAIADIDYNLHPEIAGGTTSGWCIEVMNRFGSWTSGVSDASWTFPYEPQRNGSFMWHSSPAIGELITGPHHEGLEVVGGNNPLMSIWALDGDNTDGIDDGITANLSGWGFPGPTGTEGVDWDVLWVYQTNGNVIASPAIGDLEGDGQNEVICGSKDYSLYCINGGTGSLKWSYATTGMITSSAGIADFDNNGKNEVVVGSQDGFVYFFKGDLNSNSQIDSTEVARFATGGPVFSSPALVDIDSDNKPEVIIGSNDGKIYCLKYNPSTNTVSEDWNYQTGDQVISSAAIANSGRALPTIYIGSSDSLLYVLNGNGTLIETYAAGGPIITSPSVADIDGDHKLEIAFTAYGYPDIFRVVRDDQSNVAAFSAPWPMFRHDSRHTGSYLWTPPTYACDAGVAEILSPDGSLPMGTTIIPKVKAHNYGETTATNFNVTFEIRNSSNVLIYAQTQTVASLMADSSVTVTFPSLTATPGSFQTKAFTVLVCDGEPEDNIEYGDYHVVQSQWTEEFETTDGGLTPVTGANGWEWGVPTSGPMSAHSGTKVWATILAGDYLPSANWVLNSAIYKAHQHEPVLSFYHWYNMEENRDGGNLKLSVNGGPFSLVSPVGGYPGIATWYNAGIPDQPCYNGLSSGWQLATFILPVDSGQTFQVRWVLGSDNLNNRPGWYLDDLMGTGFGPGVLVNVAASPIYCNGGTSTVTVTATGGIPPYTGTGVFTRSAGTYTFPVSDANGVTGTGMITITQPDPLNVSITSYPTSCNDSTSIVYCNISGGTPYYAVQWSNGSNSYYLGAVNPGLYTVTVTDNYSCSATSGITVVSNPVSTLTIAVSVNPVNTGTPVTFTATPLNGGPTPYIQWIINGIYTSNYDLTMTYTPADGDQVQCYMYTLSGCYILSNIITMSVGGLPATLNLQNINLMNNDELCYGATSIITVAGSGTYYNVYDGGYATMIAGQKILYLPGTIVYLGGKMKGQISDNGEYCGDKSAITENSQDEDPTISSLKNGTIRLWPNPTNGIFTLDLTALPPGESIKIQLFNVFGEAVRNMTLEGGDKHLLNIKEFPSGIYFVKVNARGETVTLKLIRTQ